MDATFRVCAELNIGLRAQRLVDLLIALLHNIYNGPRTANKTETNFPG